MHNVNLLYELYYYINTTNVIYAILAKNRKLPDDDVLTSKHVVASYMYFYVIT